MRLLTHNFLVCPEPSCSSPLPLKILPTKLSKLTIEIDAKLISSLAHRINLEALRNATKEAGVPEPLSLHNLPDALNPHTHWDLFQQLNHFLFEIDVEEGSLLCAHCQRSYPIEKSVPNLLVTNLS